MYRERHRTAAPPPDPRNSEPPSTPTTYEIGWSGLAQAYGLLDMDVDEETTEQSIDDEFGAFTTAPLSPAKTDIVKFWEVSLSPCSLSFLLLTTSFSDERDYLPHAISHCHGYPSYSGVRCPI